MQLAIFRLNAPIKIWHLYYNYRLFKRVGISYKNIPKIKGQLLLKCEGILKIGQKIKINSGPSVNIIGGDIKTNIIISSNASLIIGNNVGISNSTIICRKSIVIESDVLIGGSCKIYDTDFHSLTYSKRIFSINNNIKDVDAKTAPVVIKKGAWIGGHAIVLKGVTIGENSIVGAGSVVTKNIPDNEVWAGNPARFIRKLNE